MSDYIKRENALNAFSNAFYLGLAAKINEIPSEDVAPVVRCKDCRYYQDNNGGYPNANCKWCKDETPDADDYCSCGERKDDEVTAWDYPEGYFEMEKEEKDDESVDS